MIKVGEIYKPSQFSFEDKDVRVEVYQVSMGRVLYTNHTTNMNGEISIEDFHRYYDKVISDRRKHMEKYLIYGSNFAQCFCQLGETPEITMVDSRDMAIKTLANRIISDLKNVLKPDIFEKYMKSDADTLLEYLKGENEEENTFLSEASDGIRYSDTGYSNDRSFDDGIEYTLGVAKQVIDVDSSGNISVSLSTETDIDLEEIVVAMKSLYSEPTAV